MQVFTAEDPPVTRPRGNGTGFRVSLGKYEKPQSWADTEFRRPSRRSAGIDGSDA
jgi:hypothetical protein